MKTFKRFITVFVTVFLILLLCIQVFAEKSAGDIIQQIRDTYSEARRQYGGSFNGYCNQYVDYQLKILGIDNSMIHYNGNGYWDYYKNKSTSTGGYSIRPYSASNYNIKQALQALTNNGSKNAYNIMVCFQVGYDGGAYGHVMFIHAVIDGKVYFSESYGCNYDGTWYAEGEPTVISIDTFHNFYTAHYGFEGLIQFYKDDDYSPSYHYLDVNGRLLSAYDDGENQEKTHIEGWGTCDVYINGQLDANDVTDYYKQWPTGTTFEIKDVKSIGLRKFLSGQSNISGTIGNSSVDARLVFRSIRPQCDTDPIIVSVGEETSVFVYTTHYDYVDCISVFSKSDSIATVREPAHHNDTWGEAFYIKGVQSGDTMLEIYITTGNNISQLLIPIHVSGPSNDRCIFTSNAEVTLEQGVANLTASKKVRVYCPGSYPNSYYLTYNTHNSSLINVSWGNWDNDTIDMYLYATGDSTGTADIELVIWDDKNNWIDSTTVHVTITDPYNVWFNGVFAIHRVIDGNWSGRVLTNYHMDAVQGSFYSSQFTRNLWYLERQSDKTYVIRNLYDNSYLYPDEDFLTSGCNVFLTNDYPSYAFKRWAIKPHPEGGYYIHNAQISSGMTLDFDNASIDIGVNAQLWWENGTNAQSFDFDYWGSEICVPKESFTPEEPDVWWQYDAENQSAIIRWTESPEVSLTGAYDSRAYEIFVYDWTSSNWIDCFIEKNITTATEYHVCNVSPGHDYSVGVRAVNTEFDWNYVPYTCSDTNYVDFTVPAAQPCPFVDIKDSDYYFEPVMWAVSHYPPITSGVDDTHFGPNNPCTREQIVTFLWAANGKREPTGTGSTFSDVAPDAWYYKPVMWAVESGYASGMGDGSFGVGQACTRAQAMTFLWAAQGKQEPTSMVSPFSDVAIGDWFCKPILWAAENGITAGIGDGLFGVYNTCTRAQIITFLYKAYALYGRQIAGATTAGSAA